MDTIIYAVLTQSLTFLPLALGISVSYTMLRATDMTLDGSFVLGAGVFARLVTLGYSPIVASIFALIAGCLGGVMVSLIQRGGKVDPLLAGILATFILISGNLALMGRPNISLLSSPTLFSKVFASSDLLGWTLVGAVSLTLCVLICILLRTKLGLSLRALGDNPSFLKRLGKPVETLRMVGFGLTNLLAAAAGLLTAQTVGYADITMGTGMTLTGIGAILLGDQLFRLCFKQQFMRIYAEFVACLLGVLLYFFTMNILLRFDVDPVYLKMLLGLILIVFLRGAAKAKSVEYHA